MYLKYKIQQSIGDFQNKIHTHSCFSLNMLQKFEPVYTPEFYDFNFKKYFKTHHTANCLFLWIGV